MRSSNVRTDSFSFTVQNRCCFAIMYLGHWMFKKVTVNSIILVPLSLSNHFIVDGFHNSDI